MVQNRKVPWCNDRNKLNFCAHVSDIIKKATRTRVVFYPIINRKISIPLQSRINVLKTFVKPVLTYAGEPFIKPSYWRRLKAVRTNGIRAITGYHAFVRNEILCSSCSFKSIKHSIRLQPNIIFFKKIIWFPVYQGTRV